MCITVRKASTERHSNILMNCVNTPTYFEPGRRYRALSVALIQRDDSDDVLGIGLQAGQSVKLAVTSNLHSLNISTFVNRKTKKKFLFVSKYLYLKVCKMLFDVSFVLTCKWSPHQTVGPGTTDTSPPYTHASL